MVNLSLGTTATRAARVNVSHLYAVYDSQSHKHTVGRATLTLAIITVIVSHNGGLVHLNGIGDFLAETVTSKRHDCGNEIDYWMKGIELANKVTEDEDLLGERPGFK